MSFLAVCYSPNIEPGSVASTETVTPASEVITVPEHSHPHEHDYAANDHTHEHTHSDLSEQIAALESRLGDIEASVEHPVQEIVAVPEPVNEPNIEIVPKARGLRRWVRAM